ncbi:Glycerol uptake facilitator protein [Caloramator mitchellensis]|uniref:Glycerol uptake facilitator protein n=1 Tax=Caloramator mitchellensis TaxID=908809 RepID=A0A0R3K0A1_CALMK|nr:MIP/aquaporin family protein [Caloramator mitchellensis]KRQ86290.1 Glycerol uptake facilitator protein [Caloramator mitchellensis]
MQKSYLGELISEFIGSFILIFIGVGVVAALVLEGAGIGQWEISIVWGMAVAMAIFVTGSISGTHINPAVTLALATFKGFDKKKVIPYIIAQMLGTFAAAAVVYGLYRSSFLLYEQTNNLVRGTQESAKLVGIFSTFPKPHLSTMEALLVEIAITAFLLIVVLAVGDTRNQAAPTPGMAAVMIGITIAIIGSSFGPLTGFAMNPARDLGPRLFAIFAGWGSAAVGPNSYGFIVPIFGPIIGAQLGGFIYEKIIVPYFPTMQVVAKSKVEIKK